MNLFQLGKFKLASGQESEYKIECDALTDKDIEALAYMLHQKIPFPYRKVYGVPTGGNRLAEEMTKYYPKLNAIHVLVVDDVWTTGGSMRKYIKEMAVGGIIGAVLFARNPVPEWVTPLFRMY